jgi:hypothetical protein
LIILYFFIKIQAISVLLAKKTYYYSYGLKSFLAH